MTYAIKQIECVNSSRNVKNFVAYLKAALKDDFANTTPGELSAEVTAVETEAEEKKRQEKEKKEIEKEAEQRKRDEEDRRVEE